MSMRIPAEVFPPGEFIREELDARGWSQTDLAEILGRPFRLVNEILSGKRSITPETAIGLGNAFGTGPELWMNLESVYRLSLVEGEDKAVARRAKLFEMAPIKDMIRRQWIKPSDDVVTLEAQLARFFEVTSLDEPPTLLSAARKSTSYNETTPAQLAWLFRAKHLARTQDVSRFDAERFEQALPGVRKLITNGKSVHRVPQFLSDLGIRFVLLEPLPKTRVDGAAIWIDDYSPVVVVSLRFDRLDGFWHTLAHELGHIKFGDGSGVDNDLVGEDASDVGTKKPEEERRADEFACNLLIPQEEIESFIARVRPYYSKAKINQFANRIRVHPGIIIGQLQRRGEIKYSQGREMLSKVRDILVDVALTDGWGFVPVVP